FRSFANVNEKLIFFIFTAHLIVLQTIWLILATLLLMVYMFLIRLMGVCLTDCIMMLLVC
ncbi:hypothetical protein LINGRAHAP2_LOCUS32340, partial [Linum grandiflorum]